MNTRRLIVCTFALLCWVSATSNAFADGPIKIGINSQQYGSARAGVRAHIHASAAWTDHAREHGSTQPMVVRVTTRGSASNLPPPFPPLSISAPILKDQHPGGPGSFWYTNGTGRVCQYVPNSVTPCFTLIGPGSKGGSGQLTPAAVAQSLARRVDLLPGGIRRSPAREGLTGAPSWFWLDPSPRRQLLSISLAGETVDVTADPTVEWRFGDGASRDGGPGVPYQADAAAADAITHVYDTRCLPGDQGRDPYVLASCGQDGYSVEALVVWRISYSAAGPVAASGVLPARTTETVTAYPVSEARAFLVSGGGQ